jgi:hypothetical protein
MTMFSPPPTPVAAPVKPKKHEEWKKFQKTHRKTPSKAEQVMAAVLQPALDAVNLEELFGPPSQSKVGKGELKR